MINRVILIKIKAHTAKLIKQLTYKNIWFILIKPRVFISALLINSWFVFLGGYPRRGLLGSEDRQIKQMNN